MLADLELKGAIAKSAASFDAFSAADAQVFLNRVFKKGFFNKPPFNGIGRTELIFRCRSKGFCIRFEISTTEIAVTTYVINMNTFDGRRRFHTIGSTPATLDAFGRIQLPDSFSGEGSPPQESSHPTQSKHYRDPDGVENELPAVQLVFLLLISHDILMNGFIKTFFQIS
jgi:hypothetical protein